MDTGVLFLLVSLYGAAYTLNALRPVRFPPAMLPAFFASWLTIELAPQHIVWQAVATAVFVWAGALESWAGWVGLGVTLASWAGLVVLTVESM
ncbi:MAG TPA: hypothetical protein VM618_01595, partial [Acidimicrobiia bacterium]|nr:hypothetical protein [Acidimicrobiia bacterium]